MQPGSSTKNLKTFTISALPDNFTIILSRTDSIGDVVLTLPMAGAIKKHYPAARVLFMGRTYTRDIIELSRHVDGFINYDEIGKKAPGEQAKFLKDLNADIFLHVFPVKEIAALAKAAKILLRVGTTNRIYHWLTCNKLIRLSRKNSPFHESQLNLKLLSFLKIYENVSLLEMPGLYGFKALPALSPDPGKLIDPGKFNVILHPKSKGSAKEWGTDNFQKLADLLPAARYNVFISGTAADAALMPAFLHDMKSRPHVTDLTGKLSLSQFIVFINACDGLVAASTGPLHIAAALGKVAVGIFSSRRPIHPGRWQPVGEKAHALVFDPGCRTCAAKKDCDCISRVPAEAVLKLLEK